MTRFLVTLAFGAGCFGLGYFVSAHPDDTRAFLVRLRDSVANLFRKKPPSQP